MIKTLYIFGRQPELGRAELESCAQNLNVQKFSDNIAVIDIEDDGALIARLGGTMRIARFLATTKDLEWTKIANFISENILKDILSLPEGKINLGISCYGFKVDASNINRLSLELKKNVKSKGRSIRVVPNHGPELSTAQVLYNKLVNQTGVEIILANNGKEIILGKTIAIQDINAYAARDQARPKRDAKVGMLPPKLAQIMINLTSPPEGDTVLDPFCGTGVILQEALLLGLHGYGSDVDKRMIDYSKQNLEWLGENFSNLPSWRVEQGDATTHTWTPPINIVVSEVYLGKPLFKLPGKEELNNMVQDVNKLIVDFLVNLANQIPINTRLCIAIPAWRTQQGFRTLPILDHLEEIGYNHLSFKTVNTRELIYNRPQQLVARQLLALIRK